MQAARNVAIIMLLALAVAAVPGGEATAETILVAISIAFLGAIAWFVYRLYTEQQFTLATMSDGLKAVLFGAVGVIVLLIVGYEEFTGRQGGVLLWLALLAGAIAAIVLVIRAVTRYS